MNTFHVRPIIGFVVLANSFAWLVALPLWLSGGLKHPFSPVIALVMMATPALAALIVSKITERDVKLTSSLGLTSWKPVGRTINFCLGAVAASVAIHGVALGVGALCGVYLFDVHEFSGLGEALKTQLVGHEAELAKLPPLKVLAVLQLAMVGLGSLINAVPALGEEIGWRGWLLPKLMPLGTRWAVLISGVIWGLWHAPLILLGYNYPTAPGWLGLVCMTAMCIPVGAVLAWMRLRSGSVWPAALGHGAFNAAAGLSVLFGSAGHPIDATKATALGWTGWIFPALLAGVLFTFFPASRVPQKKHGPTA